MEYPKVKLGEVCEIIAGQSPPSETYNSKQEGLPFFQGKADFGLLYPKVRMWCSKPQKLAEPNDVLLSVRAPVGPTNICDQKSCIGRGLSAIRSTKSTYFKYVLYFFKHIEPKLAQSGVGSTFAAITQSEIKSLEIPLPPLETQRHIAAVLDRADAVRQQSRQLIAHYDELIQSVFLDMFGEEKNLLTLNELTTKITDGVHSKPNYTTEGIPFISVKNITNKYLDFAGCQYISLKDHEAYIKRCKPERNDILYTKVGATYGRAALIDTDEEFSLYVSVALLKLKKEQINPHYLKTVLNTNYVKRQADTSVKGAGVPDLHLVEIKSFKIPVPPLALQIHFANVVEQIEEQKAMAQAELAQAEALFESLLTRAFRGELSRPEHETA